MLMDAGLKPNTRHTSSFVPWSKVAEGLLWITVANTFFMALSKGILDDSCLTTQEYVELLSSVLEMFSLLLTEKVLLPVNVHGALLV